jgi:para-nitrobenzyl esterase
MYMNTLYLYASSQAVATQLLDAVAYPRVTEPLLSTAAGELRGRRFPGPETEGFYGIPYAAAPVGSGRWAPPRPATPWAGVRDATTAGPVCPQPARPFSAWAHGPLAPTAEDSLVLNVWRPAASPPAGGRPVLVFLHGGGWSLGWGSNPLLDGRHLARALDAVVVTLNYRLGSLGWLWHPALAAGPDAPQGNWGLLDQLAALHWVADHAAAIGADPGRVTLAGESAGAGSVLHLLNQPAADGLFQRAITQSPPLHELTIDPGRGEAWATALSAQLGLECSLAAALPRLRALGADAIVGAQEALLAGEFRGTRGGAMPIIDAASLPADPATAPGARPDVPLLIGTNADEGTFFFRAAGRRAEPPGPELEAMVTRLAHTSEPAELIAATRQRLTDAGRPAGVNDIVCAVTTEAWFAGPGRRYAHARAGAGGSVHRYRIDHPSAEGDLGAVHSISVPLLFGSWREGGVPARLAGSDAKTAAVTDAIDADWARFVHGAELGWDAVGAHGEGAIAVYGGLDGARAVNTLAQSDALDQSAP